MILYWVNDHRFVIGRLPMEFERESVNPDYRKFLIVQSRIAATTGDYSYLATAQYDPRYPNVDQSRERSRMKVQAKDLPLYSEFPDPKYGYEYIPNKPVLTKTTNGTVCESFKSKLKLSNSRSLWATRLSGAEAIIYVIDIGDTGHFKR